MYIYRFFFCPDGTGVSTQGFKLIKQELCHHWRHISSPFCPDCFGDGVIVNYLPWLSSSFNSPDISLPKVVRITGVSLQCPAIFTIFLK
jgi:hypothetical protein